MLRKFWIPGHNLSFVHFKNEDDDDEAPGGPSRRRDPIVTATRFNNDVNALSRHIDEVEADAYKLREQRRSDRAEIERLKALLPQEGAAVLSPEDAKLYEAYKALGKVEDLTGALKERDELKQSVKLTERSGVIKDIARAVGYESEVMLELDSRVPGLVYTSEKKDEGTVYYVEFKEGDVAKKMTVTEFYETKFPRYLPSLKADQQEQSGTPFPRQASTGHSPNGAAELSAMALGRYSHLAGKAESGT